MTNSSSSAIRSFRRWLHSSFRSIFLLSLCIILILPVQSQNNYCSHDGGLWGSLKSSIVPLAQPVQDSLCREYNKLSDTGRFVAGACVGFGASKLVVGATIRTVKTIGITYIAFEALEYAGILKEARRSSKNKQLLAQTRDYCLRTVDGIRHDVRYQLDPARMHRRLKRRMEHDKSGTVGFGTGSFLGFAL
ncbi:hypothetical protein ACHAWU_009653 [Discostella pseudostelligera]|uniref:FUN14 family protein n=1 Tax=Discostella pseudostelligera TaxID=259834 RepID=A0ABD3MAF7_9STRA